MSIYEKFDPACYAADVLCNLGQTSFPTAPSLRLPTFGMGALTVQL